MGWSAATDSSGDLEHNTWLLGVLSPNVLRTEDTALCGDGKQTAPVKIPGWPPSRWVTLGTVSLFSTANFPLADFNDS